MAAASASASATRVRSKERVLLLARRLMRHAMRVDTSSGPGLWLSFIKDEFRAASSAPTKRERVRDQRAAAADIAACFDAVEEQRKLLSTYSGGDADNTEYRRRAAKRVGLTVPDSVPLAARDLGAKYDVAGRTSVAQGVANLKQQLYGTPSADTPAGATTTKDRDERR